MAGRKGRLIARQLENLVEFLQNLFPLPHSLTWIQVYSPSELPITGEKGFNKRFTCDKAANQFRETI